MVAQKEWEEPRWMTVVGEQQDREKSTGDGGAVGGERVVAVHPWREKRCLCRGQHGVGQNFMGKRRYMGMDAQGELRGR